MALTQDVSRGTTQSHAVLTTHRTRWGLCSPTLPRESTRGSAWVPRHPCLPQGELTITTDMEDLSTALFYDTVPDTWVARAYPSMMGLAAWYADLLLRIRVSTASSQPLPEWGPADPSAQVQHTPAPPGAWL